ncbi:hypothetical protein M902_0775 [Bacteriovorax sp. BAL6_X]|uniref:hypothetical protein n=1 Tax=Bacteriovorax sp. BAL6_X TaxID=1201290 RepID=UPI0003862BAC|nr:hypothetical protein [Bacteriovorax sp. BAL6_X]EPZ49378.1 hypothetical protein M902_0775 [Bacteriovorax sp. BAL6_X]
MNANEIIFLISCLALIGVYIAIEKFIKVKSSKRDYHIDAGNKSDTKDHSSKVKTDHLVAMKKKNQVSTKKSA